MDSNATRLDTEEVDPTLVALVQLQLRVEELEHELVALEGGFMFVERQAKTLLYVLGSVVSGVYGRDSWLHRHLYPLEDGALAPHCKWDLPARRARIYKSKRQMMDLARENGLRLSRGHSFDDMAHWLLVNGVLPFHVPTFVDRWRREEAERDALEASA